MNSFTLMIRKIDLYVQIPGLSRFSRTCANPEWGSTNYGQYNFYDDDDRCFKATFVHKVGSMGWATSKGNEAKSMMKHPSDMPTPRFELMLYNKTVQHNTILKQRDQTLWPPVLRDHCSISGIFNGPKELYANVPRYISVNVSMNTSYNSLCQTVEQGVSFINTRQSKDFRHETSTYLK